MQKHLFFLAVCLGMVSFNPSVLATTCQIGRLPSNPGNYKLRGNVIIRRMSVRPLRRQLSEEETSAYNEALACFEAALRDQRASSDPEIWNGYGVALARLGRYEEAIKAYDRGLQIPPGGRFVDRVQPRVTAKDYYILWFNRGTALGDLERYQQALENIERAIRLNPSFGLAHFYRGLYLFRLGRIDEAQAAYIRATAFAQDYNYAFYREEYIGRDNYLYWQGRGFALSRIERYEKAVEAFREADRIKSANNVTTPPHITAFITANELAQGGDYQSALQKCEQAIQAQPNFALAHHCRGLMLDRLQRYPEAVAAFDQAIRLEPDAPSSYYRKGNALRKQGRFREAVAAYQQALRLYPTFFEAQNNLGVVHYELRQDRQALTAFNRALQPDMESFDSDVNANNTRYNKAVVLCTMGRRAESLSTLNELIPREDRPALKERAIRFRASVQQGRCN